MTDITGKRVLVVGLARSGKAAAEALVERGAEVVGFDRDESVEVGRLLESGVEVHLGREEEMVLQGIDLVVKSPGVPGETALVSEARGLGIPVWSEIELGARLSEPHPRRDRHERKDDDERAPRRDLALPSCLWRSPGMSAGR